MTNTRLKNGLITAALAAVCGLLVLSGCREPFLQGAAERPVPHGMGTLSLAIDGQGRARTIMPVLPGGNLSHYLEFESDNNPADNFSENWDGVSEITLEAGDWRLRVTLYRHEGETRREIARSAWLNFTITAGDTTVYNAVLLPLSDGSGTFSWNIQFPASVTGAKMLITNIDTGDYETVVLVGAGAVTVNSLDLPVGIYRVVWTLSGENGASAELSEILHIHPNLESRFADADGIFANFVFPVGLFDVIVSAWDGSEWNFNLGSGRYITAGHFGLLGILGVTDANFSDITARFNTLTALNSAPEDIDELKALVDAALILIAISDEAFARANYYWTQAAAEAAVNAMAVNLTPGSFNWTGDTVATLTVGAYTFNLAFIPVPVTGVQIDGDPTHRLRKSSSLTLSAAVTPSDARDQRIRWEIPEEAHRAFVEISSSDEAAGTAEIRGLAVGTAVVHAVSVADPTLRHQVTVEVLEPGDITITPPQFPPDDGGILVDIVGPVLSILATEPAIIRITNPEVFDTIRWFFDDTLIIDDIAQGSFVSGTYGEILNLLPTIHGVEVGIGTHFLTVEVEMDGELRSRRIVFEIRL